MGNLQEAGATRPVATLAELCLDLVGAAAVLDTRRMVRVLDLARLVHGLEATLDQVLMPMLREVGYQWSCGSYDVSQEHATSRAVERWLHHQQRLAPPPTRPGRVLLACGPQNQHTLGLDAFEAVLAHRGFDCLNLGAEVPVTTLQNAVATAAPFAVVLTCHLAEHRPTTTSALRAVATTGVDVYYAGAAYRTLSSRRPLPGTYLGGSFSQAGTRLRGRVPERRNDLSN